MLALSTSCAPAEWPLPRTVSALRELGAAAFALHRAPTRREMLELRARDVVAVFQEPGVPDGVLHVVDGRPADDDDRERSLEELCRRLHGFSARLALRTPSAATEHPAPDEIALVREVLPSCGYWHDALRGGAEHLEVAGSALAGASFHPLRTDDLRALREATGSVLPAVVWLPAGTEREEVAEAWRCARGLWGA